MTPAALDYEEIERLRGRVNELLAHNTKLVEQRRDLEKQLELAMWELRDYGRTVQRLHGEIRELKRGQ